MGFVNEFQLPAQAWPPLEIVRTAVLLDAKVMRFPCGLPPDPCAVALKTRVEPRSMDAFVEGLIVTEAGGCTGPLALLLPHPLRPLRLAIRSKTRKQ